VSFYTEVIARDSRFSSPTRCADPKLLDPETRTRVDAVIEDAREHGLILLIHETYRSRQRQETLFSAGATKLKNVGVHHFGLACDLVKSVGGEPSWKGSFELLGELARAHGLVWGGDWPHFKDQVHVQRLAVKDQARVFRGEFYPPMDYMAF